VNEPVQQEATATSYQGFNATTPNQVSANYEQKPSFGWGVLGFFVPIAGLILYLIWKDEKPLTARLAGKGALISVIVSVVLWIIYFVIIAIVLGGSFAALSSY
jgi:small-conductance mechanosensitive channel